MSSNTFRINDYLTEAELDEVVSLPDGIAKLGSRVPGYEWLLRTRLEQTSDVTSGVLTAVLHIPGGAVPPQGWRFCAGQSVLVPLRNILAWVDGGKQAPSLLVELTKLRQQKLTKELLREGIARWDSYGRSPHSPHSIASELHLGRTEHVPPTRKVWDTGERRDVIKPLFSLEGCMPSEYPVRWTLLEGLRHLAATTQHAWLGGCVLREDHNDAHHDYVFRLFDGREGTKELAAWFLTRECVEEGLSLDAIREWVVYCQKEKARRDAQVLKSAESEDSTLLQVLRKEAKALRGKLRAAFDREQEKRPDTRLEIVAKGALGFNVSIFRRSDEGGEWLLGLWAVAESELREEGGARLLPKLESWMRKTIHYIVPARPAESDLLTTPVLEPGKHNVPEMPRMGEEAQLFALAEAKKAELRTYWNDTRRPGCSGLRLKLSILRPGTLGVVLFAAEGGKVRAVRTLPGAKEIAAFTTRDLEQLADGIYQPAQYDCVVGTWKEERPVYEEAKREELEACWAQRVGLHEIGLKITEPGEDELRFTFYERKDGKRFYTRKLTGRAALRAFGPPELLQLGASAALALARPADDVRQAFGTPVRQRAIAPQLTEEELRRLKERCTKESESGPGIASWITPVEPTAAAFRPRHCKRCGHDKGCMCTRYGAQLSKKIIIPDWGKPRNRM